MAETVYYAPSDIRALVMPGLPADSGYRFSVRAYRKVDPDIDPSGVILSPEVETDLYQPAEVPAFDGDITGTIQGRDSLLVVTNLEAIASDSVLSTAEKPALIMSYNDLSARTDKIMAAAAALTGTAEYRDALSTAKGALDAYLGSLSPAWNDTTAHSPINPATFQAAWAAVYAALADLEAAFTVQSVGINGELSNTIALLPAEANGTVISYSSASGNFVIRQGSEDISSAFNLSVVSNPQSLTVNIVGKAFAVTGGFDPGELSAAITLRATGTGGYAGTTIDKVFQLGKTVQGSGANGVDATSIHTTRKAVTLSAYADGTVVDYSAAEGQLKVYQGSTDITAGATISPAVANGCTGTINTADNTPVAGKPKGYYRVTATTQDVSTLSFSVTANGQTFTETFSVSRSVVGYQIVSSLPVSNLFDGRTVYLTTDKKLYVYSSAAGVGWKTGVDAADIAGKIVAAQLDQAIRDQINASTQSISNILVDTNALIASASFPTDFSQDSKFYGDLMGSPLNQAPLPGNVSFATDASFGRLMRITNPTVFQQVRTKRLIPNTPGRRFRLEVRARVTQNGAYPARIVPTLYGLNANFDTVVYSGYESAVVRTGPTSQVAADGWQTASVEITLTGAACPWIAPSVYIYGHNGTTEVGLPGAIVEYQYIRVTDVTEVNALKATVDQHTTTINDNGIALAALDTKLTASFSGIGQNRLSNSDFATNLSGFYLSYSAGGATTMQRNGIDVAYKPYGSNTIMLYHNAGVSEANGDYASIYSDPIAVRPGEWWEVSTYAAMHRCKCRVDIRWLDALGGHMATTVGAYSAVGQWLGNDNTLSNFGRLSAKGQAPVGASAATFHFVKLGAAAPGVDSYSWITLPQVVQTSENAPSPLPYTPGPATATLTQQAGVIATIDGKTQSYWQVIANAGTQNAVIAARAAGTGSVVTMAANKVVLANTAGDTFYDALVIENGNATLAGKLRAGAVETQHLTVGATSDLVTNGRGIDGIQAWAVGEGADLGPGTLVAHENWLTAGRPGLGIHKASTGQATAYSNKAFPTIPGKTYSVKFTLASNGNGAAGGLYARIQYKTSKPAGGYVTGDNRESPFFFAMIEAGTWPFGATTYEYKWTCPAGVTWASFTIYNWVGGPTQGYFTDVEIREQVQTVDIIDGGITGDKLAFNSVLANHIKAGEIDAGKMNITELSALTGRIGILRTADTGPRVEIRDDVVKVFGFSSNLAVRLGNLSL